MPIDSADEECPSETDTEGIAGALIDLIEERSFEALTVGELTERALVSRAAFYRNYEEAMSALLSAVGDLGREYPPLVWVTFFEHVAEYERLYRALLGRKGSPWFVRKMRTSLAGLVKERGRLPHGPDASERTIHTFSDEFVPDLVSTMFVEAITWWLEHTPKEIATRSALLASALFKEVSTWQ
ncbi:MAG: TetR family transcriptional regulator [Ktedonobacteraceae bacterium]